MSRPRNFLCWLLGCRWEPVFLPTVRWPFTPMVRCTRCGRTEDP